MHRFTGRLYLYNYLAWKKELHAFGRSSWLTSTQDTLPDALRPFAGSRVLLQVLLPQLRHGVLFALRGMDVHATDSDLVHSSSLDELARVVGSTVHMPSTLCFAFKGLMPFIQSASIAS